MLNRRVFLAVLTNQMMLPFKTALGNLLRVTALVAGLTFLSDVGLAAPACTTDMTPYLGSLNVTGMGAAIIKHGQVQCTTAAGNAISGNLSGWTLGAGTTAPFYPSPTGTQKHAGSWSALLGAPTIAQVGDSRMYQTVTLPAGQAATLTFWYRPFSANTITYAWQEAQVQDNLGNKLAQIFKVASNSKRWTQVTFNLTPYAGRTVRIHFNAYSNGGGYPMNTPTGMYLDDVSVTAGGQQLIQNGGFETEQGTPYTADTAQTLASVSKSVVATAVMQLYEQGRFSLDDPINNHLPFQVTIPSCAGTPITFRQLLTHTASIKDNYTVTDRLIVQGDSPISLDSLMRGYFIAGGAYYSRTGNFYSSCPNRQYQYSNLGATLLAYLVQVISGQDFNQYATQHIFTPLGMTNTSFLYSGVNRVTLAMPYTARNGDAFGLYGYPDYPDGTLKTSVTNLAKFLAMFANGGSYNGQQILQPSTVALILSQQTTLNRTVVSQGLIWYETGEFATNLWGHSGLDFGINTNMFFSPTSTEGVILFANGQGAASEAPLVNALLAEAHTY